MHEIAKHDGSVGLVCCRLKSEKGGFLNSDIKWNFSKVGVLACVCTCALQLDCEWQHVLQPGL